MEVFKLEEYLANHEFSAQYLLCCSDAETFSMQEILEIASPEEKYLWDHLKLDYTEVRGLPLLRKQIATSLYPELSSDNILCFAGAEEGIFCALHTICEPGDDVITFTPAYQSLIEIPKLKGASITEIALLEEEEWRVNLDKVRNAVKPNTKAIIINFPHNPTGQVLRSDELKELVDICTKHDLWLFSDEVYYLLGNPEGIWAPPAATIYPKAITLGVMSKAFGMAGLRIGWIACQDKTMLKKIEYTRHYTAICNSAPAEIIALIALKNKDKILKRNNQIVKKNLLLLDDFFLEYHDQFAWIRPQAGCTGFVQYKGKESVEQLATRLMREKGVAILPSVVYDHGDKHFRVGFGKKNMEESLERFKEFLK